MTARAVLFTLSYDGDLPLFETLAHTVDAFAGAGVTHHVAVPAKDLAAFRRFSGARRTIMAQEDLLPAGLRRIPLPPARLRKRLGLPVRNLYFSPQRPVIGGWIVQQLMKIAFASAAPEAVVVHVDSDLAFVDAFDAGRFLADERVRLFRVPEARPPSRFHAASFAAAAETLGLSLPPTAFANFIGSVIPWRRATVRALTAHVERIGPCGWPAALMRASPLAEYMLYGVFCEHVAGFERAGHVADELGFCETVWTDDQSVDPVAIARSLQRSQIAIGLQSTLRLAPPERLRIIEEVRLRRRAA